MTSKEYLQQIRKLKRRIEACTVQLDELTQYGAKAIDYSAVRVQTTPGNAMEDAMIRIADAEQELNRMLTEYISLKKKIILQIHSMKDERYEAILYKRYVEMKNLEGIAQEMNYSYDWTCRLHGQALKAFGRLLQRQHTKTVL